MSTGKKILTVFLMFIALAILGGVNANASLIVALAIGAVAVASFFKKIPVLSESKGFTMAILFFCVFTPIVGGSKDRSQQNATYLAGLRAENPKRYLEEIRGDDRELWLKELKVLDPEGYATELGKIQAEQERVQREQAAEAATQAEERRKGFHCLSQWDGSHTGFRDAVQEAMRDPDSFEHIQTLVWPGVDGWNEIRMEYRAANGFGGMNVGVATGHFRNSNCDFQIESFD